MIYSIKRFSISEYKIISPVEPVKFGKKLKNALEMGGIGASFGTAAGMITGKIIGGNTGAMVGGVVGNLGLGIPSAVSKWRSDSNRGRLERSNERIKTDNSIIEKYLKDIKIFEAKYKTWNSLDIPWPKDYPDIIKKYLRGNKFSFYISSPGQYKSWCQLLHTLKVCSL